MSTGTSGDLLDDRNKHAQSVFKHEILRHYIKPFIAMPGSTAADNRVVILDGFAGRGRYPDGEPASAELILQAIRELQASRKVTGFFAEKERVSFESLSRVVREYQAGGLDVLALPGNVENHLDKVVAAAIGVPLFLFLDPCGAGLPFERLRTVLSGPRRENRPQTEVLLNFSADLSRRTGGLLNKNSDAEAAWMDDACGGPWWRDIAMNALRASEKGSFEPVVHAVAEEYARRLAEVSGSFPIVVPVRRRLHHQPIYHLIFLTRSPYGLWVFADAVGKARAIYLRHLGQLDDDEPEMLFTPADDMEWLIEREWNKAIEIVKGNIRNLLRARKGQPFKLVQEAKAVFGSSYGFATESVVVAALQALVASREAVIVDPGKRLRERVIGAASPLRAG
ncbi:three-Cys-motif partner protein TcmP [Planomonospora sp. ID67723]|uniref:three-Cys-motif partner protein TcmP n=1 Tax=Planomonospora sp. ID67723 TaxID=2738134 RepID=UPI0018C3D382|nr:three-Cys-motif partner protein TcmP [Planomonospora sp. ID67723]MBG0830034.1 three-Cys-motif partner protein TcmP [Planomonospora sp. ID67723]